MASGRPCGAWSFPALALAVALGACTPSSGTPAPTPTTASPTPAAPGPSPPTRTASLHDQVTSLWEAVHDQRLTQVFGDDPPDPAPFAGLASQQATGLLLDFIELGRGEIPADLTDHQLWPQITIPASADRARIEDCILVASQTASQPDSAPLVTSQVWTGTAVKTSSGWVLDDLSIGVHNCVPPDLNRELLDAYRAYHNAWTRAWDPPNPQHPLLEQTMTGHRLEEIRRLLEEDQAAGIVFRDPHDPLENAVVFDLGIGEATVSDCHPAHEEYGAYDLDTGQRLDDEVPPPRPGQLNLTSVDLVLTSDADGWKVAESASLTDTNCEPRGTPYVVAP